MKDDLITRRIVLFHVVYESFEGEKIEITLPTRYKGFNYERLKNSINRDPLAQKCKQVIDTYESVDYYYMPIQEFLQHAKKGRLVEYAHQKRILPL